MHIRLTALLPAVFFAAIAAAAPSQLDARQSSTSECNTGPIMCCNTTYSSSNSQITELFGLLGITIPSIGGLLGLGCSPIGGVGAVCAQQPVCCNGNTFEGLVNIGCSPIIINV